MLSLRPQSRRFMLALAALAAFAALAPRATAAAPTVATARITPSGELLYVEPLKADGTAALHAISAVADGATITIDGVTTPLTRPIFSDGWRGFAYPLAPARVSAVVDDADAGWSPAGTWTELTPYAGVGGQFSSRGARNGQFRVSSQPSATATWTFAGLTPGKYRLSAHLWDLVGPDRTTQARYTARDGAGTVLKVTDRDLTTAIYPAFDRVASGMDVTDLGEVVLGAGQASIAVTLANVAGSGLLVADALVLESAFVPPALPGSAVTASFPAGTATVAGQPTEAATDLPVTYETDETFSFPIPAPADRKIKLGYNVMPPRENLFSIPLADRSLGSDVWDGDVVLDAHCEMTANNGVVGRTLLYWDNTDRLSPRGTFLMDDGPVRVEFNVGGSVPFDDAARSATGLVGFFDGQLEIGPPAWTDLGGGRWRLVQDVHRPRWKPISERAVDYNPRWAQGLRFRSTATGVVFTDWRWYGPEVPIGYAGTAHPADVARLGGWLESARSMDWFGTNWSQASRIGDFPSPLDRACSAAGGADFRICDVPVLSIRPVDFDRATDPDHFWRYHDKNGFCSYVVAEVADAGAFTAGIAPTWTGTTKHFPSTLAGGEVSFDAIQQVYKLDDTHLLVECLHSYYYDAGAGGGTFATLAATQPITGTTLRLRKPSYTSLETFVAWCRDVGCSPWVNVPHASQDAFVDWIADRTIEGTPDGKKIYFELSNEVWNSGFGQVSYFGSQYRYANWLHSQDPVKYPYTYEGSWAWYAHRAHEIRERIRARMVAAGRNPDLVHMATGGITQNLGMTVSMAAQAQTEGFTFDSLSVEAYQDAKPPGADLAGPDLAAAYSRLSAGGKLDLLEISTFHSGRAEQMGGHRTWLDKYAQTSTVFTAYEGGWAYLDPQNDPRTVYEMMVHPRMYHLTMAYEALLQSVGYVVHNRYTYAYYAQPGSDSGWTDLYAPFSAPGTGDGTENANALDYRTLVSEQLGGRRDFALGVVPTPKPGPGVKPGRVTIGVVLDALKVATAAQIDALKVATAAGNQRVAAATSAAARAMIELANAVMQLAGPTPMPAP